MLIGSMHNSLLPAQWGPHQHTLLAWPTHKELWQINLRPAQKEFAAFCKALINAGEHLKILVANEQALDEAQKYLESQDIEFLEIPYGDIWLRDTAPIFTKTSDNELIANIFKFNGWGNKYLFAHDTQLATNIVQTFECHNIQHDFFLEGGAIETDGMATCLTTKQCLLNKNRNPKFLQPNIEKKLKDALGFEKILWVDRGLYNDHTDGHIDTLTRFIAPGQIVCMRAHYKSDQNFNTLKDISNQLKKFTDTSGNKLEVIEIPSPGEIKNTQNEIMPASFMNFFIANNGLIVPVFDSPFDQEALGILSKCMSKEVLGLPARVILTGGGTFNCITQQVPTGE